MPGAFEAVSPGETDAVVAAEPGSAGVEAEIFALVIEAVRALDAIPFFPEAALVVALALEDLPIGAGANDSDRRGGGRPVRTEAHECHAGPVRCIGFVV